MVLKRMLRAKKLNNKDLSILGQQFYNMIKSGCDFITILDTIIYVKNSEAISNSCRIVRHNLEKGKSLSESFSIANSFPKFFVNMVYAGEVSGNIDTSFNIIYYYYNREKVVVSKLKNATIYPILLLFVSFIAINIVFMFVVPNFKSSFLSDGFNVGLLTKCIFKISDFIRSKGIVVYVILLITTVIFIRTIKNNPQKRASIENKLIKLKMVKRIKSIIITEKFSRVLCGLLNSGINISESIKIASSILNSYYAESRLEISIKSIESGSMVSDSLEKSGIFPTIFIAMIKPGEESGRFTDSLEAVSEFYKNELDVELDRLVKLIEPIFILVLGTIIGLVMLGLMYPILNAVSNIS